MKRYNSKTYHSAGEVVSHEGKTYKSIRTSKGMHPTNTDYWQEQTDDSKPIVFKKEDDKPAPVFKKLEDSSKPTFKKDEDKPKVTSDDLKEKQGTKVVEGKRGPMGPPGKDGRHGKDGNHGKDGRHGKDGKDGAPGRVEIVYKEPPAAAGGGSANKHRIYPASLTGHSLVQESLPSRSSIKTILGGTGITLTDSNGVLTVASSSSSSIPQSNFSIIG